MRIVAINITNFIYFIKLMSKLESSQATGPQTSLPPPNVTFIRGFNELYENNKKKLQQTAVNELGKIRSSLQREKSRQKLIKSIEDEDWKKRQQIRKGLDERFSRMTKSKSENIKKHNQIVKQQLLHVQQVHERIKQSQKLRNKQIKQKRQAANNDIIKRLKERENEMRKSFLSVQSSKNQYPDALSKKNNLYLTNLAFAEQAKDKIFQKILRADKNYKQKINQRLKAFASERIHQNSIHNSAKHIFDDNQKDDIRNLMLSLKKSEIILASNEKNWSEKIKAKHYNEGQREMKMKDNIAQLKKSQNQKHQTCKLRMKNASLKSSQDMLLTQLNDRFESQKSKSLIKESNLVRQSKPKHPIYRNKSEVELIKIQQLESIMDRKNNLTKMFRGKFQLLEKVSSLRRHVLFNKDRLNPQNVKSLH